MWFDGENVVKLQICLYINNDRSEIRKHQLLPASSFLYPLHVSTGLTPWWYTCIDLPFAVNVYNLNAVHVYYTILLNRVYISISMVDALVSHCDYTGEVIQVIVRATACDAFSAGTP